MDFDIVEGILIASERRIPPGRMTQGHTFERHVYISNVQMLTKAHRDYLQRVANENRILAMFTWATAFVRRDDAVRAALDLLTSADGQRNIGQIIGAPGQTATWDGPTAALYNTRYTSGHVVRTCPTQSASITVVALPRREIHIHTCFPVLGGVTQRVLANDF